MTDNIAPTIRKARYLHGDTLTFRDADTSDAEFILQLRTDPEKSRHLSQTPDDVSAQQAWLQRYAKDESQAYFIIEYEGERIGTVRLYDAAGRSFCWGSWILKDGRPRHAAMESALMVYAYALDHLGFDSCHFDVRKSNIRVIKFHQRFGAALAGEKDDDYLFTITGEDIQSARIKHTEFLSGGVTVST